ncbi:hypothetical protein AMAG_04096 [Allomyces macrogynus ATCC 38327]|uniref:Elongator complex protein 2 n=1 Tax=Allomyces macrogynus (strain ATCC 38327) TaxID=578462 RepID=A0A0L0S859_ALLM3|nr:hypothetical protein AMAG_04096 [Allomyces macrogynus ATCC 38327]|eukprot:KNE58529.1 hypothetical protein AMAG_04096 [Allomyces macrogynus ATCC 38327]
MPPTATKSAAAAGSPVIALPAATDHANEQRIRPVFLSAGATRTRQGCVWPTWGDQALYYLSHNQIVACRRPDAAMIVAEHALVGHTDRVLCIADVPGTLVTGAADMTLRVWDPIARRAVAVLTGHEAPVHAVTILNDRIVSSDSRGVVRVWQRRAGGQEWSCVQTWTLRRYAITAAFTTIASGNSHETVLALGASDSLVHLYLLQDGQFVKAVSLPGHENWISTLAFTTVTPDRARPDLGFQVGDVLLASGAQDKYIRLWRLTTHADALHNSKSSPSAKPNEDMDDGGALSTKAHVVALPNGHSMGVFLDSVLMGHEDWVNAVTWSPAGPLRLASASSDQSVMVWAPPAASDIVGVTWSSHARMGELGGHGLAFHSAAWRPDGLGVAAMGHTGGVHLWVDNVHRWKPATGVSGHISAVQDLTWDPTGSYLLTTSTDQTTRLFAPWSKSGVWHELGRPQIHGYDLNCLAFVDPYTLVSGADEKIVRIFGMPSAMLATLEACGAMTADTLAPTRTLAVTAQQPALGLSNKAVATTTTTADATDATAAPTDFTAPPLEERLLQDTLWPETEKLYGHAFEITAVAATPTLIATACRATARETAVVRLYEVGTWQERAPLVHHTLTVTRMAFSPVSGKWFVTVGRDRGLALWRVGDKDVTLQVTRDKAHARIVWDVCWAPDESFFVTGSRDKTAKVWTVSTDGQVQLAATFQADHAVTSVALTVVQDRHVLALGLESGEIAVLTGGVTPTQWSPLTRLSTMDAHTAAVNGLAWRTAPGPMVQLASCSDDHAVRLFEVNAEV